MIEWSRVETLREEVGDEAFDEVVELFLEEVEQVMTRLRTAPDPSRFEHDLHFLKGSAMNLGFRTFSALCEDGEKLASLGNAQSVDIAAILHIYARSRAEFLAGSRRKDDAG